MHAYSNMLTLHSVILMKSTFFPIENNEIQTFSAISSSCLGMSLIQRSVL